MTFCNCCGLLRLPGADQHVGAFRYPETYGQLFNCRNCSSTYLLVQWEAPDDELPSDVDVSGLLDDTERHLSGLRDVRAA